MAEQQSQWCNGKGKNCNSYYYFLNVILLSLFPEIFVKALEIFLVDERFCLPTPDAFRVRDGDSIQFVYLVQEPDVYDSTD